MSDLPPLEQQQAWVVVGANEQVGPYTLELLISEVVAGRLADTTPVWWPALADWTTMSSHSGVAGEIARRRGAPTGAPAWAAPVGGATPGTAPTSAPDPAPINPFADPGTQAQSPYGEPTYGQPQADFEPAPSAPSAFDQSAHTADDPSGQDVVDAVVVGEYSAQAADPSAPEVTDAHQGEVHTPDSEPSAADNDNQFGDLAGMVSPVDADVRTGGTDASQSDQFGADTSGGVDEATRGIYEALVARSSRRAEERSAVEAVDEQLVATVTDAVTQAGFGLDDRADVDRGHELRFGEPSGNLVVVSLGRIVADQRDAIGSAVVPVTISYRSGSPSTVESTASTAHGDIVVTPDEWTGQSTSSSSLFLGVGDYLNEDLSIKADELKQDIGAAVSMVRVKLA